MSSISFHPARSPAELCARIVAHLIEGELDLPILPDAAARVLHATNEAGCDSRRLAGLIEMDPAMAGHVLRVANSSAYAPREPIVSLQQSVSRLGFATVREIAVAVALHGKMFAIKGHEDEVKSLWLHSAIVAAWAKEIARMRRRNVEGAFLSGLLHDVGRPIIIQLLAEVEKKTSQSLDAEIAHKLIEEYHTIVGERLVTRWSLPSWVASAARWHHDPDSATADAEIVQSVCLADLLAHWTADPTPARLDAIHGHRAIERLNFYVQDVEELLAQKDEVERSARAFA